LFQIKLIDPSAKWYVDEKYGSHTNFESLDKSFISFFQLPIRHDIGLNILFEFKQTTIFHIMNHIHEWCRRWSIFKINTTPQQRLDWFTKDVATTIPQTEDEAITKAQQFDLIYSQLRYLYTMLPNAPLPLPFHQDKPGASHTVGGLIGSMAHFKPYAQPIPTFGANQYPLPYGGVPYYPPPIPQPTFMVPWS
jgi:hypothetical protein